MTDLAASGFEAQSLANDAEGTGFRSIGSGAIETTVVRSGAASYKVAAATSSFQYLGLTSTRGVHYAMTMGFRRAGTPTALIQMVQFNAGGTILGELRLTNTANLRLFNKAGAQITPGTTPAAGVWHLITLHILVPTSGNGVLEMYLNSALIASSTSVDVGTTAFDNVNVGVANPNTPGTTLYFDDFVLRDSQSLALPVAIGASQAVELGRQKQRALLLASETDTAQLLARQKRRTMPIATEVDVAQVLTRRKQRTLPPALEVDQAQALGRATKIKALPTAAETDQAQALGRQKRRAIAPATETDLAIALTAFKRRALPPATEQDVAQGLGRRKTRALPAALEADVAGTFRPSKGRVLPPAVETDVAVDLGRQKLLVLPIAVEVDEAMPFLVVVPPTDQGHAGHRGLASAGTRGPSAPGQRGGSSPGSRVPTSPGFRIPTDA